MNLLIIFFNIVNIMNNCYLDYDCIFSQFFLILDNLTEEESKILDDYLNDNGDCKINCAIELSSGAPFFFDQIYYHLCGK